MREGCWPLNGTFPQSGPARTPRALGPFLLAARNVLRGGGVAQKPLRTVLDITLERVGRIRVLAMQVSRVNIMVGRSYFQRQAATLLKFAKSSSDPQVIAALVEKADELRSQADETTPSPDLSARAPDIEPETHA